MLPPRVARKINHLLHSRFAKWILPLHPRHDAQYVGGRNGTSYGRYIVPAELVAPGGIAYCAGIGEDLSFEQQLATKYGMEVYAFDPTPHSIEYATKHAPAVPRLRFFPIGWWSSDTVLRFAQTQATDPISCTALDAPQVARFLEFPCRRVDTLMREHGHAELALAKMNIEGAEIEVVNSMLEHGVLPRVLVVEMDHPSFRVSLALARRVIAKGYELIAIENRNYTFIRKNQATS